MCGSLIHFGSELGTTTLRYPVMVVVTLLRNGAWRCLECHFVFDKGKMISGLVKNDSTKVSRKWVDETHRIMHLRNEKASSLFKEQCNSKEWVRIQMKTGLSILVSETETEILRFKVLMSKYDLHGYFF